MICGVKILLSFFVDSALWVAHDELLFRQYFITNTGEIPPTQHLKSLPFKGLTFTLIPTQKDPSKYHAFIKGSLHRYKNDGLNNADDFSISDIREVLKEIKEKFYIDLSKAVLQNIEFGVNIELPFTCDHVLERIIGTPTHAFETKDGIKRIVYDRFELKIYDKGGDFKKRISSKLLRVEVKVKKMESVKNSVSTLSDLVDIDRLKDLGKILLSEFDKIMIHDEI